MTMLDCIKKEGREEGKAEGEAKGSIRTILKLHREGVISTAQARSQLKTLSKDRIAPRVMISEALKKIAD